MKSVYFIIGLVVLTLCACGTSKYKATAEEMAALESLINKRSFKVSSDWANPTNTMAMQQVLNSGILQPGNNAGAISLTGNSNFLTISGDSISSFLPYYGERQMQVDYNGGDSAIQFEGILEDYKVVKNKNGSYTMSFQATSKSERYNGIITIFPNLRTDMVLSGASRFSIRYSGVIIEEEE